MFCALIWTGGPSESQRFPRIAWNGWRFFKGLNRSFEKNAVLQDKCDIRPDMVNIWSRFLKNWYLNEASLRTVLSYFPGPTGGIRKIQLAPPCIVESDLYFITPLPNYFSVIHKPFRLLTILCTAHDNTILNRLSFILTSRRLYKNLKIIIVFFY